MIDLTNYLFYDILNELGIKEVKNMKKNKPVEVEIKETTVQRNGNVMDVHQLFIGKKLIGEVEQIDETKYQVSETDSAVTFVKTMESGYEEVLRSWNLHN